MPWTCISFWAFVMGAEVSGSLWFHKFLKMPFTSQGWEHDQKVAQHQQCLLSLIQVPQTEMSFHPSQRQPMPRCFVLVFAPLMSFDTLIKPSTLLMGQSRRLWSCERLCEYCFATSGYNSHITLQIFLRDAWCLNYDHLQEEGRKERQGTPHKTSLDR